MGAGGLAKDVQVALAKLWGGQTLKRKPLAVDVHGHGGHPRW